MTSDFIRRPHDAVTDTLYASKAVFMSLFFQLMISVKRIGSAYQSTRLRYKGPFHKNTSGGVPPNTLIVADQHRVRSLPACAGVGFSRLVRLIRERNTLLLKQTHKEVSYTIGTCRICAAGRVL